MRCNICNTLLEYYEVVQDEGGKWEPCSRCKALSVINYDETEYDHLPIDEESDDD